VTSGFILWDSPIIQSCIIYSTPSKYIDRSHTSSIWRLVSILSNRIGSRIPIKTYWRGVECRLCLRLSTTLWVEESVMTPWTRSFSSSEAIKRESTMYSIWASQDATCRPAKQKKLYVLPLWTKATKIAFTQSLTNWLMTALLCRLPKSFAKLIPFMKSGSGSILLTWLE